jgi:hypothetical protein
VSTVSDRFCGASRRRGARCGSAAHACLRSNRRGCAQHTQHSPHDPSSKPDRGVRWPPLPTHAPPAPPTRHPRPPHASTRQQPCRPCPHLYDDLELVRVGPKHAVLVRLGLLRRIHEPACACGTHIHTQACRFAVQGCVNMQTAAALLPSRYARRAEAARAPVTRGVRVSMPVTRHTHLHIWPLKMILWRYLSSTRRAAGQGGDMAQPCRTHEVEQAAVAGC